MPGAAKSLLLSKKHFEKSRLLLLLND